MSFLINLVNSLIFFNYYLINLLDDFIINITEAATAAEHAHYLFNKEITTPNQIYGIKCLRTNVRTTAGKPARPRRVAADSKVGQHTEKRDTIINLTQSDPTTTTKEQRPEMAETYKYLKRHQGRPREERGGIPTHRGSMCGLRGRINYLGTLVKAQ